jgi:cation transport protein ChaC
MGDRIEAMPNAGDGHRLGNTALWMALDSLMAPGSDPTPEVWLFGYGSLMWRPEFDYLEARPAQLTGYHRHFCIYSHIYRGTRAAPGLVLGLDRGGSCWGRAFRLAASEADSVLRKVDRREIRYDVYRRHLVKVRLDRAGGARRTVLAHAYVANRACAQYAGRLPRQRILAIVREACGEMGRCRDYLENTVRHLDELGLPDQALRALLKELNAQR